MTKPAILVISSHVVRGTVGNRAAVFALETLGHPVWAVPTVTLPWHPGHGPATRIVPSADAFAAMLADLERAAWLGEVGGILTGYLGGAEQAASIARLIAAVKVKNPEALYVCDPVIGDSGGLYVPPATAEAIRDHLLPLADIATPNRAELDWLAGRAGGTAEEIAAAARDLPPPAMLVTSAPAGEGRIGNLWVERDTALLASHDLVARPPNGLGDLTAALLLARRLDGKSAREAIRHVTAAVYEILSNASARGADELMLETDAASLTAPNARVDIRNCAETKRERLTHA
ncbi:pyridoxal kinase PdxY [Mesorhizobium sp. YIM 152430]|uniref:pyridoxal kinase PdxY n=1 Tax=Mesorhizobium sp. YIM 152430 TaxID=3031761 RepID=UPI0023D9AF01|nr:pyridoxal kinase PdxY [Mesorhizobium sp. YIM 152430]MDF1600579.1 pyridoxal kinase PdxY [Mesorhizobium sp. YIM 152430]